MDYEFIRNDYNEAVAIFSIGHEAIGHYLTIELGESVEKVEALQTVIRDLNINPLMTFHDIGREYQIHLSHQSVEISNIALESEVDEDLPEDTELYDQEHQAECGLFDFQSILSDWLIFIKK